MAVIGISGSYGGLNVGDEAILTCALREIRQAAPDAEVVVFSRNAEHTQAHHAVDRLVAVRDAGRDEIAPEIQRLDLLLLGGGGAVCYKVSGFLADVGLPARTLEEVHAGPLLASIDRCWDERRQVVETLDAHVPTLQARARETVATTLSVLSDQAEANDPDSGTRADPGALPGRIRDGGRG
jgi:hypothetical protein